MVVMVFSFSRFEAVKDDDGSPPPFPVEDDAGGMDHDHIQELLASTMKQIEERKKQHQSFLVRCHGHLRAPYLDADMMSTVVTWDVVS